MKQRLPQGIKNKRYDGAQILESQHVREIWKLNRDVAFIYTSRVVPASPVPHLALRVELFIELLKIIPLKA